jgi:ribose transport system permease protein
MIIGILNTEHGIPVYLCVPLALLMGALVGLINGAFVVVVGIDSFIVTLGTGTFLGGVVLWISNSETFSGISSQLTRPVIVDRFLGVPLAFYYGLAVVIAVWYFLEYTSLGRQLLFVGRNRSVARLTGLRVGRLRWGALVASGVIAAAAGVLYAGITGAADPVSGAQFLLPAFAAAFLGATAIVPGRFNAWGSFIAVYFLVTGITGLTLFGVESWVQDMFYGGALVLAVTISQLARRREEHETGAPEL